jgi:hypothetical protein
VILSLVRFLHVELAGLGGCLVLVMLYCLAVLMSNKRWAGCMVIVLLFRMIVRMISSLVGG